MLYNEGSEVRKMAGYSELIKNFERVRAYIREFYVYGCNGREEASKKSARTYDNEKRRIESWLHKYMGARRDREGKTVFLSLDSRRAAEREEKDERNQMLRGIAAYRSLLAATPIFIAEWVILLVMDAPMAVLVVVMLAYLAHFVIYMYQLVRLQKEL